jgi:alpha-glucosidase
MGLPKGTNLNEWLLSDGTDAPLDRKLGLARARAAALFTMALPGCVYMYQGEELGLFEVEDLKHADLQDPIWSRNIVTKRQRAFFKRNNQNVNGVAVIHVEKGRDGCRVPLPWTTTGRSFGFGVNNSHLPQPSWFGEFSVQAQSGKDGSTLELYRDALKARKKYQSTEDLEWVKSGDAEVLHFKRANGWHCIMNFGGAPYALPKGQIIVASGKLSGRKVPQDTCVWVKAAE